jgi:hypothetical protein
MTMSRLALVQSGLIAAVLLILMAASIGLGQADAEPRSPVRRGAFCDLPCWRGIQPGETLIAQANRIMLAQGYNAQNTGTRIVYTPPALDCTISIQHRQAVVTEIQLRDCPDVRLGHVLNALGQPGQIAPNLLTFDFDGGRVRVQLYPPACGAHLSPDLVVQFISLSNRAAEPAETGEPRWRGFALPWRYRRAQPNITVLVC